ncbi:MAG: Carboxylesterase NlhH [Firmicutes bacterium ADurb.Bin193]|nr:MAG: Carboxylesterase NlhH [Firmicutes bacterium ADurb.Bin193]
MNNKYLILTMIVMFIVLSVIGILISNAEDELKQPEEIKVIFNGKKLEFDVPPMIVNDRTLVPFRALFEAMGATIHWDEATQTVTGVKDTITIQLKIDYNIANVNGKEIELDTPAMLVNSRTMVPLRFVSENFNMNVSWDDETKTIEIKSDKEVQNTAANAIDNVFLYKTVGEKKLYAKVFKPEDWKATDKRSVVVYFHGGGWQQGDKEQFDVHGKALAKKGLVAISVDYRLRKKNDQNPTTPVECVEDARDAIIWVRQNAQTLGIDPNRVIASGLSAGGHLAMMTGVKDSDIAVVKNMEFSIPNVIVTISGVLDAVEFLEQYNGGEGFFNRTYYGKKDVRELTAALSPYQLLTADFPPTLIIHGTADTTVPYAQATKAKNKLDQLGVKNDLLTINGGTHGLFPQISGSVEKTVETIISFSNSVLN